MKRAISIVLAASAAACLQVTDAPNLAGQDVRITVLHTSDLHSRLLPYQQTPGLIDRGMGFCAELGPFGGAARMQHLLRRERAKANRVLHVDSGDCFQGAPIFNSFNGEAEIKVMAAFRPHGVVIGNHEFDLGSRNIARQYAAFGQGVYPLLAANYLWSDPADPFGHDLGALLKPYEIVNLEGVRIALIGMGNTSSMTSIREGGNSLGIIPMEPAETLRSYVNALLPEVDLIFVVSHMGLTSQTEINLGEDTEMITGYERITPRDALPVACTDGDPFNPCWRILGEEPDGQYRVWVPGVVGVDAIFGGHLHIVLNPPKIVVDPIGRRVPMVHSGAFAKFFGRFDALVRMPDPASPPEGPWLGAELVSHTYSLFPITNRINKKDPAAVVACPADNSPTFAVEEGNDDIGPETQCGSLFAAATQVQICQRADACRERGDACTTACREARQNCRSVPAPVDMEMLEMLDPYSQQLYQQEDLNRPFAFATDQITRFGLSGEDSALGNLVADSMRLRNRVESQFAMTNSLGIRTSMEEGMVTIEQMFNIFPFENSLTTIFLSGTEVQELLDYVTERSAGRGCQTQAQVSGIEFVMNCAQALRNEVAPPCETSADCQDTPFAKTSSAATLCVAGHCFKHAAQDIRIQGEPISPAVSYKATVNDFIGRGGSGFEVLRRNTTKINTTLSLRDALIDYMRTPPEQGGPGRICGSPFLRGEFSRPPRPHAVFDKDEFPNITCESRPAGCSERTGRFIDCEEDDDEVRFFCIKNDFTDPSDAPDDDCDGIAQVMPLLERQTRAAGAEGPTCESPAVQLCRGQTHCCERPHSDGSVDVEFYCMTQLCVDPPPTGRIRRIVQ